MKINLKLHPDTLVIVHKIAVNEYHKCNSSKFDKSLRAELWEILSKKCIAYTNNPNGKPRTISLRYHLASTLQECIDNSLLVNMRAIGTYEYNKLIMLQNDLYQKLL